MKTFASDWTPEDDANRMKCEVDATFSPEAVKSDVTIDKPARADECQPLARYEADGTIWYEATTLLQVCEFVQQSPEINIRIVNGNTSYGIYKDEFHEVDAFVDVRNIIDMQNAVALDESWRIGAGMPYADLVARFDDLDEASVPPRFKPAIYMAHRTAGGLVRNAATIGGNTMLVLHHIQSGEPFPSDLATALCAVGAQIKYVLLSDGSTHTRSLSDLMEDCRHDETLVQNLLLQDYYLPYGTDADVCLAQKTALREVNSHSIVNMGSCLTMTSQGTDTPPNLEAASIVLGGIAPYAWHASQTEAVLSQGVLDQSTMSLALETLTNEVRDQLLHWATRRADVPNEGFDDEYLVSLAQSYLYKAMLNALEAKAPGLVPDELESITQNSWGTWPVSRGQQSYSKLHYMAPLTEPYIKLMAMYQAQGEVHYTHEQPPAHGTAYGALITSERAIGQYNFRVMPSWLRNFRANSMIWHEKSLLKRFRRFREENPGGSSLLCD